MKSKNKKINIVIIITIVVVLAVILFLTQKYWITSEPAGLLSGTGTAQESNGGNLGGPTGNGAGF